MDSEWIKWWDKLLIGFTFTSCLPSNNQKVTSSLCWRKNHFTSPKMKFTQVSLFKCKIVHSSVNHLSESFLGNFMPCSNHRCCGCSPIHWFQSFGTLGYSCPSTRWCTVHFRSWKDNWSTALRSPWTSRTSCSSCLRWARTWAILCSCRTRAPLGSPRPSRTLQAV